MRRLAVVLFLLCVATFAAAQKVDVFGGYQLTSMDSKFSGLDRQSFHGWNADLTAHITKNLGLVADFGAGYKTFSEPSTGIEAKTSMYPILFGPRVGINMGKVTPFVEGLFGFAHSKVEVSGVSASQNKWAMAFGGGLDFHVSNKVSLRLPKFDYLMVSSGDPTLGHFNNLRVATGIVFNF